MATGYLSKANALFRHKEYHRAMEEYLRAYEQMPALKHIIQPSIERCRKYLPVSVTQNIRVRFFPDYSASNPYQTLLYSDCPASVDIKQGSLADAFDDLRTHKFDRTVFHLHWVTFVLANAVAEEEAKARVQNFLDELRSFVVSGGELVWTIHNVIEHDCKYPDVEKSLRLGICALASRVHIHSKTAIAEIEKYYPLPASKILIVPHGNYLGYYKDSCTREDARKYLGIDQDELVFLSLGQIRPYKGVETLLRAFSEVRKSHSDVRLIIAGKISHPYNIEQITAVVNAYTGVTIYPHQIPDAELQYYYRASDAVLLAYKQILTSGSVYCALSFDRPVIAPAVPTIAEVVKQGTTGFLYDNSDPAAGLRDAMLQFCKVDAHSRAVMEGNVARDIVQHNWKNAVSSLFDIARNDGRRSAMGGFRRSGRRYTIDLQVAKCEVYEPDDMTAARVAIVILNYKTTDDVEELVESIRSLDERSVRIVIVDNYTPEETVQGLCSRFPGCVIIRTDDNLGYAGGNNVGIRYVEEQGIPYIWILNPDAVTRKDTLSSLLRVSEEQPETHIWGSLITYYDRPDTLWFGGGYISLGMRCAVGHLYHEKPLHAAPRMPYEVDYVTGASIFCRTEVFERAGLIPEQYFLYFEETDWCVRARAAGLRIKVNPQSVLLHKKRSQNGKMPTKYYMYYFVRGAMLFRRRFSSLDVEQSQAEVMNSFVKPWLDRIKQVSPDEHPFFEKLTIRALNDGANGISGRQNLSTILNDGYRENASDAPVISGGFSVLPDKRVVGWVLNRVQPEERLSVSVFIDGQFAGTAERSNAEECTALRPAGAGNGFSFLIPAEYVDHKDHRIVVYAEGVKLPPGEYMAGLSPLQPAIRARIDGLSDRFVKGWCIDDNNPQATLSLVISSGNKMVAAARNDQVRSDLRKHGFKSNRAAFSTPLPLEYCDGNEHNFTLQLEGGDKGLYSRKLRMDLSKYPQAPTNADLSALYQWIFTRRELWFVHPGNRQLPALTELEESRLQLISKYRDKPQTARVSIIMPVYNRAEVLKAAIDCVCAQTYVNWELLICDDGSTDESVDVIRRIVKEHDLGDRVILDVLPHNQGVSKARNVALNRAKGDVIAYLDTDNTWDADFLLIMVNALTETGPHACAYCGDRIAQHYSAALPDGHCSEIVALRFGHLNRTLIENKNYIDLNVFVHSRTLFDKSGGFREDMRRLVDWELILRYIQDAPVKFVPAILATYNFDAYANQISRTQDYGENASKLKQTVEAVRAQRRDALMKSVASIKGTTASRPKVSIILLNDNPISATFELVCRAWADTVNGAEIDVTVIDTTGNFTRPEDLQQMLKGVQFRSCAKTEVMELIDKMLKESRRATDRFVVIASAHSVPAPYWLDICLAVSEKESTVGAITAARVVSGASLRSFGTAVFKNSRTDFDYDVAPIIFDTTTVKMRLDDDNPKNIIIDRSSSFFCFLTRAGVAAAAESDFGAIQFEELESELGVSIRQANRTLIYASSLRMREITH